MRIVHRGRDQIVEIDILDIERLAHVRAAVAQQLRHRLAVARRIEFGLDLVGLRRDLAHRQRGRENLDQNCIHRSNRAAEIGMANLTPNTT